MTAPRHEDAQLLVQLAQWGTSLGLDEAIAAIFADGFDPEAAEVMDDPAVRKVLTFGESIGTLTKHGLLNELLVTDWLWVEGLWARVAPAAARQRAKHNEPRLYENFEALATS